ncbi:MAG: hypothetical protein GX810_00750 [Clostridiales bacterium]|nr:hypothetical protein [Clostridiales bacterium]
MTVFEDAASITLSGRNVYLYGIWVASGLLACGLLLISRARASERTKDAAFLSLVCAPLLGLLGARLLFAVADSTFREVLSVKNLLDLSTGGFAMYGALLGACVGIWLSSRVAGVKARHMLDLAAPSLLLFVGFARIGEGYTSIGTGKPVLSGALRGTVLTVADEYGDYLRTYALEAVVAFVLFVVVLWLCRKPRRTGDLFLLTALLYGVTQTLMESLRNDRHLDFGFVGLQHVLSAMLFGAVLVYAAIRWLRQGRPRLLAMVTLVSLPVLVGLVIALEFAIDRTDWNKLLCYLMYAVLLAWPVAAGWRLLKGSGETT